MKEFMKKISNSFEVKKGVYSSRKLTAFVIVLIVVITHIKWLALGNFNQLETVLTIDYAFIAALFGMTTYHSIKNKDNDNDKIESDDEILK